MAETKAVVVAPHVAGPITDFRACKACVQVFFGGAGVKREQFEKLSSGIKHWGGGRTIGIYTDGEPNILVAIKVDANILQTAKTLVAFLEEGEARRERPIAVSDDNLLAGVAHHNRPKSLSYDSDLDG